MIRGTADIKRRHWPPAWWVRWRDTRRRVQMEDALKHVHACEWQGSESTRDSLGRALRLSPRRMIALIARLEAQGLVRTSTDRVCLTQTGRRLALEVIRAHRLWERYLADEARMPLVNVHAEAERREHDRAEGQLEAVDAALGHPSKDPHGDPIPTPEGELARLPAKPLTEWPLESPAQVVHLEDEPPAVYAQIAALGLHPGNTIWILEADARRIVLSDGNDVYVLAPAVAGNIFVGPVESHVVEHHAVRLTELHRGQQGTIHALDDTLQGFTRRRLMDLGLTPGTRIVVENASFARDPVAYRVRGSLLALRADQASHVLVIPESKGGNGHA